MSYQDTFKRYEMKYLVNKEQKEKILEAMEGHMILDEYGRTSIRNIYYDTPDYVLVRRSMEKPIYKEKLRVRSYGPAKKDGQVFVEIKKKYNGIVYKRRIRAAYKNVEEYMRGEAPMPVENQITGEIDYFLKLYKNLGKAVLLTYDREAYKCPTDSTLRITFDENILWRDKDISLSADVYGNRIIKEGESLMELKISKAMPLWLADVLAQNKIYQTSFSKYGEAYKQIYTNKIDKKNGEIKYA